MSQSLPARVFLVDEDVAVRSRMRTTLDAFSSLEVVGEAAGPHGVSESLPSAAAHVLVVGGRPEAAAVAVCRLVREEHRDIALLVRTSQVGDHLLRAVRGGVYDFVSDEATVYDFLRALDRVVDQRATGLTWSGGLDEEDLRLLRSLPPSLAGMLSSLTPQERRVLELYVEGLTLEQIGEQLFLAPRTVRTYVQSIGHKLGWPEER